MSNTKIAKVHVDLINAFQVIGKDFADKIKRDYNLSELYVPDTVASQIIAGKVLGRKAINFRIRKNGLNRGVLEIVN